MNIHTIALIALTVTLPLPTVAVAQTDPIAPALSLIHI